MMNQDEKLQQIWDFRRRDDGDSSSDDSKSRSGDKNHKIVGHDLTLVDDDDEVSDAPKCPKNHKNKNVRLSKKKKKKRTDSAVADKSKRCLLVKESKKRTRPKIDSKEKVLFEDLKTFADSLIHDLKVAREDMSARMRQETGSFVSLTPILGPKKAKHCKKKNLQPDRSIKSIVTSDASDYSKAVVNYNKGLDPKSLATNYDRVVSSRSLTPPTVVIPKSHLQKNGTHLNDHENLGPNTQIAKTTHGFSALRQEVPFGGFLGQNCSGNVGFGFPVPLHQGLGYSSNVSSKIYENSFEDKSEVNLGRANGRNPAISEYVLANGISSNVHRSDGGFLSLRSQDAKELQLYMASLRNNRGLLVPNYFQ